MKAGIFQLVPHEHTAKLKPHAHTSYASLLFVLLLVGVIMLGESWSASAATPAVNPQTGSVGLSGTVRGPAPKTSAIIVSPRTGSSTSATPITVTGTCPTQTVVSVTKNGVFGGVTACQDDGTFSLQVDLFEGSNALVAEVADALGQNGPSSPTVNVTYNAPSLAVPGAIGKQLFLETNTAVVGGDPQQTIRRVVNIVGGNAPYAISWDWGDNQNSLISQAGDGPVSAPHVYTKPGTYRVIVRVTDALGGAAYLQLINIVNGPAEAAGATNGSGNGALPGELLAAWPLFILVSSMVLFFWLGERRQLSKLKRQKLLA